MQDAQARELVARIDGMLDAADDGCTELVAAVLELYGEGLARVVARVPDPAALAGDELVSHLLLLHGLHPEPVEARVRAALDEVRPYLDSHGGDVELLAIEEGVVRLRLQGSCKGCPSSAASASCSRGCTRARTPTARAARAAAARWRTPRLPVPS